MRRILYFWIFIFYIRHWQIFAAPELSFNKSEAILQRILELKGELAELTKPYVKITLTDVPSNCVQMQCKFICFNGKSSEIERDVERVLANSATNCNILEELRIYNYEFPNGIIPKHFLGNVNDKIESLYIATSNVTDIEGGAFGNGIYKKLSLEYLQLFELRRDFFENISIDFQSLSIIQTEPPIKSICLGFLDIVQSQIKYLSLQVGVSCVRNMTASDILLSNLAHVDYSYNDLSSNLSASTFNMLTMVEHLDLSHSRIRALPKYIFSKFLSTLRYLDISYNQLKTISTDIFGWEKTRSDLLILANDNNWKCNCELHIQMKAMYGLQTLKIYCTAPEEYYNWSVFDGRLCEERVTEMVETTTIKPFISTTVGLNIAGAIGAYTSYYKTKPPAHYIPINNDVTKRPAAQYIPINNDVEVVCQKSGHVLKIKPPSIYFSIVVRPKLRVDVILQVFDFDREDYGIIGFSKVTKEFYKMEVNFKDYGLNCYGKISYLTTIEDLVPNTAYTFCLVQKNQTTVSPFSCNSVHIPGNLHIRYAWLTRDIRTTGISLAILGVVLCTFVGILMTFLILKQKPILLKGSKRIATPRGSGNEIVVLPKDRSQNELRIKEDLLAKRASKGNISLTNQRRGSTESTVSYQSYMNTNLYEELPAYLKFDAKNFPISLYESDYNYIPPNVQNFSTAHMVSYAEIPARHKRTSNDPLPEIPKEETEAASTNLGTTDILKHDFELSTGFAFAYDCVV